MRTIQPTPRLRRRSVKMSGSAEGRTSLVTLAQVPIFKTLETLIKSLSIGATPRAVLMRVGQREQRVTVMADTRNDLAKRPSLVT
jgi:hypothetical protein